ncbi:MAG: DUF4058 family protein [Armatimonadaceae bacterium]
MPNPFPGMNPYLENRTWWRGVHARLIAAMDESLNRSLPPGFISTIEERVYLAMPDQGIYPDVLLLHEKQPTLRPQDDGSPLQVADAPFTVTYADEEISEPYIEVRVAGAEDQVIAVLEVLSPTNKAPEAYGRDSYIRKRNQVLQSETHLIEVDLLRDGMHTVAVDRETVTAKVPNGWRYVVALHRAGTGRTFNFWAVPLWERLPRISVPLTTDYPDVVLDLQGCLDRVYEAGGFSRRIDYRTEPAATLSLKETAWLNDRLREQGLR